MQLYIRMARIVKNKVMVSLAYSLIPKQKMQREVAYQKGNTNDIIAEVTKTAKATFNQTSAFAQKIKGPTQIQTLKNVWLFIKTNIHYIIDPLGIQDVKEPSAIWWSRNCDCKGYAIFAYSILRNLNIPAELKFAGYDANGNVTHVYVIVPNGKSYITLDGCMPGFNQEKAPEKIIVKK